MGWGYEEAVRETGDRASETTTRTDATDLDRDDHLGQALDATAVNRIPRRGVKVRKTRQRVESALSTFQGRDEAGEPRG